MKVLFDTVAVYRAALAPEALPPAVHALLGEESTAVCVSLVSAWELAIKSSLGKLPLPCSVEEFFTQAVRDLLGQPLGIDLKAIARVATLPTHHADPFDRLIIAQALIDDCAVVTSDTHFAAYGVKVVW
jgi:PIN domain nuclease of toxin-antitoxin system